MRLDPRFRLAFPVFRAAALTAALFVSGMPVSASGQTQSGTPAPVPAIQTRPSPVENGTPISIDDAVRMALENNLGIQAERLNPQIASLGIARASGAFVPAIVSSLTRRNSTAPPTDFLSTGGAAVVTSGSFVTSAGVQQALPFGGTSYTIAWDGSRATSDAPRTVFSPQLGSDLNFQATQPLLRNFKIDSLRQQLLQSRIQTTQSDLQLQQRVVQTGRSVRAAYYNLVGAIAGLEVAQQSLDLARESLKNNQTRVEVGTMAPIDIVAAEAEVASNEEAVIIQQAAIESAQDQLRALVMNPAQPGFWNTTFKPTDQPVLAPREINVDAAIKNALEHRTDILQFRKQMESTDVSMQYARNQKLPAIDLTARYGVTGVGGTQYSYENAGIDGTVPERTIGAVRSFSDVLRDVFGNDFRTWSFGVNVSYPLGTSVADAAYAQARIQRQQEATSLSSLELQIATSVREAARSVNTNLKRVEATRKARELAEKRLEAEQKRFTVGLSTTFELFQAQRDLARARQAELSATIDYNRSLVDYEAVQSAPLGGGGSVSTVSTGGGGQ